MNHIGRRVRRFEYDHPDLANQLWSQVTEGPILPSGDEATTVYRGLVLHRVHEEYDASNRCGRRRHRHGPTLAGPSNHIGV
jgi:hypothetical protein